MRKYLVSVVFGMAAALFGMSFPAFAVPHVERIVYLTAEPHTAAMEKLHVELSHAIATRTADSNGMRADLIAESNGFRLAGVAPELVQIE